MSIPSIASDAQSSPSLLAVAVASAIIAGLGGYFIGQASSIGVFGGQGRPRKPKSGAHENEDSDDSDDTEHLNGFEGSREEVKLVLVVRSDLGMTKGKIAAQASHATLACYKALASSAAKHPANATLLRRWEREGQTKVAVQVKSEDELELLQAQAESLGICARVIHDAGRTQIAAGSATVLGVGPAPKSKVDAVTGSLKLL